MRNDSLAGIDGIGRAVAPVDGVVTGFCVADFGIIAAREIERCAIRRNFPDRFEDFGRTASVASAEVIVADTLTVVGTFCRTLIIDEAVAKAGGTAVMVRLGAIFALVGCRFEGVAHVVAVKVVCARVTRRIARVVIIGITFTEGGAVVFDDTRAVAGTGDAFAGIYGFQADEWIGGVVFVSLVTQADGFILGVDEAQSVSTTIDVGTGALGILNTLRGCFGCGMITSVAETCRCSGRRDEAQSVSAAVDVGAGIIGGDACVGVAILVAVIADADGFTFGRQKTSAMIATRHILTGICLCHTIEDAVLGMMVAFFAHTDGADRRSRDTFAVSATRDAATDFVDIVNREIFLAC